MIKRGEAPTRLHNNCSGKHTGFLTLARHWDIATAGYEQHDHPVQRAVAKVLGELSGIEGELPWGIDGCAAPNFALPLSGFAHALARLAAPDDLPAPRAQAARRIVRAMIAYPELVAGTGRACTILMRACDGRAAVKTGAEGYFAGIVPEAGLGIALKIDDGAGRAAETAMAAILDKLGVLNANSAAREIRVAPVTNTRNTVVGERRPARALAEAIIPAIITELRSMRVLLLCLGGGSRLVGLFHFRSVGDDTGDRAAIGNGNAAREHFIAVGQATQPGAADRFESQTFLIS